MFRSLFSRKRENGGSAAQESSFVEMLGEFDSDMRAYRAYSQRKLDDTLRDAWFKRRLWWRGPHKDCCPKCFQAGFVTAILETGQTDLLAKYPELIAVYEELIGKTVRATEPCSRR